MNLLKFVSAYEKFYPSVFAELKDPIGLLVAPDVNIIIKKILVTNDLTVRVVRRAIEGKFNLIMCYHPLIFRPLKTVSHVSSWQEDVVIQCIKNDIAVYATHTVLDNINRGMTDFVASHLGHHKSVPILPMKYSRYSTCYNISLEYLKSVFWKFKDVYVEPNFPESANLWFSSQQNPKDLIENIPLLELPDLDLNSLAGLGRLITLIEPQSLITLYETICKLCKNKRNVSVSTKNKDALIRTIGIVPGSGGTVLKDVVCDLILTGEMSYHSILEAVQNGQHVILTGHTGLENPFLEEFKNILKKDFDSIGCDYLIVQSFITEDVLIDIDALNK